MAINIRITPLLNRSRTLLLIILLAFLSFSKICGQKGKEEQYPYDQETKQGPPPFKERLFFGGYFGLQFGSVTDIQIAPIVGYWLLPRLAVAIGPDYRYYKYQDIATTIYGVKAYLQLVIVQDLNSVIPAGVHTGIFFHLENELLNLDSYYWKYPQPYTSDRFWVDTFLAGGGISQQLGRRSSVNFMVLWTLNKPDYTLYSNPEIRVSFNF
jgi:hypothetical protein